MSKKITFRLVLISLMIVLPLLTSCAAPAPQVVEKVVTQIVEKPVVQTVQVEVPKEVVQTVEVEKVVTVQVPVKKEIVTIAYNGYWLKTFGPADPPLQVLQREVAKLYPDIEIQFNLMPYDAGAWHDAYLTWFVGEEPSIDLIGIGIYWVAEFGEQGWVDPLNDVIDQKILDGMVPAYVDAFTYNGKIVALGPWWGGIGGLYYRKDLLEAAGIEPPKTYDELVTAAKQIVANNPGMVAWTWPAFQGQELINRWIEYLNGFGGTYFDASGKCVMNSDKGVAALTFMKGLIDTGITPRQALGWNEMESQVLFGNGQAVFHTGRQDLAFWLDDAKQGSQVIGKWAFVPMVGQPDGHPGGYFEGWGFGINKYSKHKEAAAKVLNVMFDFPVQKDFNLSQGPLQGNAAVYTDPDVLANNKYMAEINAVAQTALPPIPSPNFNEITVILQKSISSALVGTEDAKAALDEACKQIDALKK